MGTTYHVTESVQFGASYESFLRFSVETVYMKRFSDVSDTDNKVVDRLGHALGLGINYEILKGRSMSEPIDERLQQIEFDLKLIEDGIPLVAVTRDMLLAEKKALIALEKGDNPTLPSHIQLSEDGKEVVQLYDDAKIFDLYTRSGYIRDILIKKDVVVEANPTSNVGMSPEIFGYADHSLKTFITDKFASWTNRFNVENLKDLGCTDSQIARFMEFKNEYLKQTEDQSSKHLRITINVDDGWLFDTNNTKELYIMGRALGLSKDVIDRISKEGFKSRMGGARY